MRKLVSLLLILFSFVTYTQTPVTCYDADIKEIVFITDENTEIDALFQRAV